MRHILYIVGAGLSRALQGNRRVPIMNDFLSVMADYLDNKVIQVTLARYAKQSLFRWPVPPDLCALAEHVHNRQAITPGLRGRVANALKRMPQENIEDLLSSDKQIFEGKEGRFRFAINAIFVEIGWNVRFEPLNRFLMKQLSLPQTRHTFLNFNYDLFLEYAIRSVTRDHFHPTWDPLSGYGFEAIEAREDKASLPAIRQKSDIQILKPHGSLNWMVPFIGAHEFQNCCAPTIYLENGELAYNSD